MRRSVLSLISLFSLEALAFAPSARASGDMLQPNEIQTHGIEANPANDSGMFLGGGVMFGQSYSSEPRSSSGLAYFLNVEPGYQVHTGSWNRLEVSGDFLFGHVDFRTPDDILGKVSIPLAYGFLARLGYGYSIGNKSFGIMRIGVGPMLGKLQAHAGGVRVESESSISGLAAQLAWEMVGPINDTLDWTGGLSLTHMQFDVGKVQESGGTSYDVSRDLVMNVPTAQIGLRVRF